MIILVINTVVELKLSISIRMVIVINLISLFSGIGAPEAALKRIGIKLRLIGFSEVDKYAIKSYCKIHQIDPSLNYGDITKIDLKKLPTEGIDLITHGSPCTDFSLAGKNAGGDKGSNTRSSLMWYAVEVIRTVRPRYILWENVKNVLSKKHKHNFDKYLSSLEEIGYKSYYKVLNAKDYGIPQNRERIFVISIRNDIKQEFKFPEPFDNGLRLIDFLDENVEEKYYINQDKVKQLITNIDGKLDINKTVVGTCNKRNNLNLSTRDRVYNPIKESPTLCATDYKDPKKILCIGNINPSGKGINGNVYLDSGLSPTILTNKGEGIKVVRACLTPDRINKRQKGRRFKGINEPMFTITTQDRHGVLESQLVQYGILQGDKWDKMHESARRIYDPIGISPTIHTCSGGNTEAKVIVNV